MKPTTRRAELLIAVFMAFAAPMVGATPITFTAVLNGPNESPPNASPGVGFATVNFDIVAHTMQVDVTFAGLLAGNTAAHIHCCTAVPGAGTASVATTTPTFAGFPTGVAAGNYSSTLDMTLVSSYNPAFITNPVYGNTSIAAAEAALFNGMLAGRAYFNIHTSVFPGGEIRGFLQRVPEPGTLALLGFGLAGLGLSRRRKAN